MWLLWQLHAQTVRRSVPVCLFAYGCLSGGAHGALYVYKRREELLFISHLLGASVCQGACELLVLLRRGSQGYPGKFLGLMGTWNPKVAEGSALLDCAMQVGHRILSLFITLQECHPTMITFVCQWLQAL